MAEAVQTRPQLTAELSGGELRRWYWLKDELVAFARVLGVRTSGGKELLAERIAAHLDGVPFVEPSPAKRGHTAQLGPELTAETRIPAGQRCSEHVRAWLSAQTGSRFHFDAEMRAFFAAADGTQTMHDALEHWRATRDQGARAIDAQFEYNRFTRQWRQEHPLADRTELLAAWHEYRARPIDERGRV